MKGAALCKEPSLGEKCAVCHSPAFPDLATTRWQWAERWIENVCSRNSSFCDAKPQPLQRAFGYFLHTLSCLSAVAILSQS